MVSQSQILIILIDTVCADLLWVREPLFSIFLHLETMSQMCEWENSFSNISPLSSPSLFSLNEDTLSLCCCLSVMMIVLTQTIDVSISHFGQVQFWHQIQKKRPERQRDLEMKVYSISILLQTKSAKNPIILAGKQDVSEWSFFTRSRYILFFFRIKNVDSNSDFSTTAFEISWYSRHVRCIVK